MPIEILGKHPFARDAQGSLISRIGTLFLHRPALVTLPGIHATQRLEYAAHLNRIRQSTGLPPLTPGEEMAEWEDSVDLIMEQDRILIRPDPGNMRRAFDADEILQGLVSKRQIKFLYAMNEKVRQAVRQRGECWRISPLPRSQEEMKAMIREARIAIGCGAIYFYNMMTGTRYLTCSEFARLGALGTEELALQLQEIRDFSGRRNRRHYSEVDFFATKLKFGHADFAADDYLLLALEPAQLKARYAELLRRFVAAVPPALLEDDLEDAEWRRRLVSALVSQREETVSDDVLHGLSTEFYLRIEWLPGGRIEDGELIFDSIFEEAERHPEDSELRALCDERAKGFIFNFIREFGDVEYVNIGRVVGSLSAARPMASSRRRVYIAEIMYRGAGKPAVRIVRLQKWGVSEHLDEGKDLLRSILEAEEYTEYILDRRLGCRQLGMNLAVRTSMRKLAEKYQGRRREFLGQIIWSAYFERDYIHGVATDKIPSSRYESPEYALRLGLLLGRAAAPNIIVGRANVDGTHALFDDGDEVVAEDPRGMPADIIVADHTGTFSDYLSPLQTFAADYARPVTSRASLLPDPTAFAKVYLDAFLTRYLHIQLEYRKRRRGFDTLFKHRQRDVHGSFAFRWEKVLERLDSTDGNALVAAIAEQIRLQTDGKVSVATDTRT